MDSNKRPTDPEPAPVDEVRRHIVALTAASTERHRLERGSEAYAAALEAEERLAEQVWRMGTSLAAAAARPPVARRPSKPPKP